MNETHESLRETVREVCAGFPGEYWRALDEKREVFKRRIGQTPRVQFPIARSHRARSR